MWEAKILGLAVIFVYAFFKFAWSYRLYNYVAILVGAAPQPKERHSKRARQFVKRTARICEDAGRHFNRGQRAFFFALGYLGWFLGPVPLALATTGVVIVMWRRQFGRRHARPSTPLTNSQPSGHSEQDGDQADHQNGKRSRRNA